MASEIRSRNNFPHLEQDGKAEVKPAQQPNGVSRHPGGPVRHGLAKQALRMSLFALYFFGTCIW